MRIGAVLGIAVGVAACADPPAAPTSLRVIDQPPTVSAVTSSTELTRPFSATLWIPCANGGVGEMVKLLGQIEIQIHTTEDENGGLHMLTHVRPSGVVGVGAASGLMYRGTGGTFQHENEDLDGYPATYSYSNIFRIIGQGRGNNLMVHLLVHQTVNANGEATADVELSSQSCK